MYDKGDDKKEVIYMMGYGNFGGMMGGSSFFGLTMTLFTIFILVDLFLLGIWLWKQIQKKK